MHLAGFFRSCLRLVPGLYSEPCPPLERSSLLAERYIGIIESELPFQSALVRTAGLRTAPRAGYRAGSHTYLAARPLIPLSWRFHCFFLSPSRPHSRRSPGTGCGSMRSRAPESPAAGARTDLATARGLTCSDRDAAAAPGFGRVIYPHAAAGALPAVFIPAAGKGAGRHHPMRPSASARTVSRAQ